MNLSVPHASITLFGIKVSVTCMSPFHCLSGVHFERMLCRFNRFLLLLCNGLNLLDQYLLTSFIFF